MVQLHRHDISWQFLFDFGLIYQLLIEAVATTQSAHNSAYQPTMVLAHLPAATSDIKGR